MASLPFPRFELFDDLVHLIETLVPDLSVALEPLVQLPQWRGAEPVDPLLCPVLDLHQLGVSEHSEVLRHLGLIELERGPDGAHRAGALAEQVHDPESVRLGQGGEGLDHGVNILLQAYSCQGIYSTAASPATGRLRSAIYLLIR
jgi:hypothetical protein